MKQFSLFLTLLSFSSNIIAQSDQNLLNANVPAETQDCCSAPQIAFTITNRNSIVWNGDNTLTLSQPIAISASGGRKVIEIKADFTYFEFLPGSEDCFTCNKNSSTFGNFSKGTFSSIPALGSGTHNLTSNFAGPQPNGNFPASLTITLPPIVKCCEGVVRWCVRYIVTLDDCTVCAKVVCYEKKKSATATVENHNPINAN